MNVSTVLVAEDNADDYLLLERAFRKAAIPVTLKWVKDGSEAKDYVAGAGQFGDRAKFPLPVFILVDLKMPRMDGFEFLSWIRSHQLLRRIPVLILTSSNQILDINKAYDGGANSYLVKPGRFEDLLQLAQALRNYWLALNQNAEFSGGSGSNLEEDDTHKSSV